MVQELIVDASVVAKLYLRDEQWVKEADQLFARYVNGEFQLLAPRIIWYEVPAAIIGAAIFKGRLDEKQALEAIRSYWRLHLPMAEETNPLLEEAFRLAQRLRCFFNDAIYLALAQDLNWTFVTADEKLYRSIRDKVSHVMLLPRFA